MRDDLEIIAALVNPGARVLDLGCGSGELLRHLADRKGVNGYGVEKDPVQIGACVRAGVNVIEQDLDAGLVRFPDSSFDMVVMTETLQAVGAPSRLLDEMLRIGRECIVTFPNFGHWRCRLQLLLRGRMPVAGHLPHSWHATPNIHLCTFRDFESLVRSKGLPIIERFVVDARHAVQPHSSLFPKYPLNKSIRGLVQCAKQKRGFASRPKSTARAVDFGGASLPRVGEGLVRTFPNLFGTTAFYRLGRAA